MIEAKKEFVTTKSILSFLEKHDHILQQPSDRYCCENELMQEILDMLKRMPNFNVAISGSFWLRNYEKDESEIFYILDMTLFLKLLKEMAHCAFIHELKDFIQFKILRDGNRDMKYLPTNIKNALILTIEKGLEQEI